MPRSGVNGTFTLPGAQATQQPNTTIPSAVNNQGWLDVQQTFNTPQPIAYGGTNATNAADARTNLGLGGAFTVVRAQTFAASGTYTPNPNMIYCIIECIGGGGAGGGVVGAVGSSRGGGGGGSGSYSKVIIPASVIGASKAVTVGAGGTGVSAATGGAGGSTSVSGAGVIAIGGSGGIVNNNVTGFGEGGSGGSGGTGIGSVGSVGQQGNSAFINSVLALGGAGGPSAFGGNGKGSFSGGTAAVGGSATFYGGGGGGASVSDSASSNAGGSGAGGLVIITEFCSL